MHLVKDDVSLGSKVEYGVLVQKTLVDRGDLYRDGLADIVSFEPGEQPNAADGVCEAVFRSLGHLFPKDAVYIHGAILVDQKNGQDGVIGTDGPGILVDHPQGGVIPGNGLVAVCGVAEDILLQGWLGAFVVWDCRKVEQDSEQGNDSQKGWGKGVFARC